MVDMQWVLFVAALVLISFAAGYYQRGKDGR